MTTTVRRRSGIRFKISPLVLLILVLIAGGAVVLAVVLSNTGKAAGQPNAVGPAISRDDLQKLWDEQSPSGFKKIIDDTSLSLRENPLQSVLLLFRGFAEYRHAINQQELEARTILLMQCVIDLRKCLILEPFRNNSDIDYFLGKAYYELGYFYHDLSRKYLLLAAGSPSTPPDVFNSLGAVSSALGNAPEAIDFFQRALDLEKRDEIGLAIITAYLSIDKVDKAKQMIDSLIANSKDPVVVEKARFKKADILYKQGKRDDALAEYLSILKDAPNSADAHFYVGEMYAATGDMIKARAEWREAYTLDNKHSGAINRLNTNTQ